MANVSDYIEKFILEHFTGDEIDLSRNELADFFSCAPSQINYVLSTRFTPEKGYIIKSQRGGGGYIRLTKIYLKENSLINEILNNRLGDELDYKKCLHILHQLNKSGVLSNDETELLVVACSPKALSCPFKIEDKLRANIVKTVLLNKCKEVKNSGDMF